MLLLHAPPSPFLRTLLRYNTHNHHSSRAFFFSLSHFTKPFSISTRFFSRSRLSSLLPMSGQGLAAGGSSSEHFTGDWYSVPELRLRDHRFTVPLDHSRGSHSSPKITVFAREVVAGNASQSELCYSMIFSGFDWLHSLFPRCLWFVHEQKFSDTIKFCFFSFLICGKKMEFWWWLMIHCAKWWKTKMGFLDDVIRLMLFNHCIENINLVSAFCQWSIWYWGRM